MNRKLFACLVSVILAIGGSVCLAAAVDSRKATGGLAPITSLPTTSGVQHSVGAAPFVLMSGYVDTAVANTSTFAAIGGDNNATIGNNFQFSNWCYGASTTRSAYCWAYVRPGAPAAKVCPRGFLPYVDIDLISGRTVDGSPPFACAVPSNGLTPYGATSGGITGNGTTGPYEFQVVVSAVPTDGSGLLKPAVNFSWSIMCYPANNRPPLPPNCGVSVATDQRPILLWDKGLIRNVSDTSAAPAGYTAVTTPWGHRDIHYFNTNRRCPPGYNPRVSMKAGAPYAYNSSFGSSTTSYHYINTISEVCVAGLTTNTSNYSVAFLAVKDNLYLQISSSGYYIEGHPSYRTGADIYDTEWTLECYPPGAPVPAIHYRCSYGSWPYYYWRE